MSRDEILNMEAGREMDALIAEKVMNWNHNHDINECEDGWYSYCRLCGYEPRFSEVEPGSCEGYPCYSTDISAAWEVVEKMKGQGDGEIRIHFDGDEWICFVGGRSYGAGSDYEDGVRASADTAPLAICRAALLAVMEE